MKKQNILSFFIAFLLFGFILVGCSDDDAPPIENEEEIITDVSLIFSPDGGGAPIVAIASDPDGEGPQDLQVAGDITLSANTTYNLAIELVNDIANEDITKEIEEEDDEHLFFFSFSDNLFDSPEGDGNVDNRSDAINYSDQDENGLPVGLSTSWTTGTSGASGSFRVILKHQPNIKSATSGANDGESDADISWDLSIQ